jgi:hypothetical protein
VTSRGAAIHVSCPGCGETYHASPDHAGRSIRCVSRDCGRIFRIEFQHLSTAPPTDVSPPVGSEHAGTRGRDVHWSRSGRLYGVGMAVAALIALGVIFRPLVHAPESSVDTQPSPVAVSESQPAPTSGTPPSSTTPKRLTAGLRSGANVRPPLGAPGRGTLRIHNGTGYDAVVTLLDTEAKTVRRYVYLRAGDAITLADIAPCHCRLFFALGTDWDAVAEEFLQDASFAVFDESLQFTESETERGLEWATFSVTLHPVAEGKARTTRLSKEEFERQSGKRQTRAGI